MLTNWDEFFEVIKSGIGQVLNGVGFVVDLIPWWLLLAFVFVATYRMSRKIMSSVLYTLLLFFIGTIDYGTKCTIRSQP